MSAFGHAVSDTRYSQFHAWDPEKEQMDRIASLLQPSKE
jgi:hypothetical protein